MRALAGILCVALASGAVPPAAWAAASRVRVEAPQTGVLPPGAGVLPSSSVQFPSLEAPSFPELSTQPQAGVDAPHELTASAQAAEALAPPPMAPPMAPPSPAETRPPADKPGLAALTKESAELADVPAGSPAAARSLDHAFVNAGTAVRTQSFDAPAAADAAPSASPLAPAPAAHALLNETASNPPAPEAGAGSGLWAALRRLAGSLFGPAPKTDPNDPFHDPRGGLRLDLYVALIQHILDLDAPEREAYRDRIRAALDSGAPGPVLEAIAAERRAAGFPFEPARLETALDRQTGTRYQAAVELLNNGFDAMGDAIGRFGMGVFQAVGWLEEDGDNLEYRGRDPEDPTRQRWVRFSRARGRLWVDLGSETRAGLEPGTEVVLRKKSPIRQAELRGYLRQKLGLSRRGAVVEAGPEADHVLNDLSAYRTVDGEAVSYRLGAASVRFEVGAGGRELRFRDSGRGLSAAATAEALPVPGVSTNRSNAALARDLQEGAARPRSEELFYRPGAPASRGSVVLLVGGTEVETLAVEGQDLAPEVVLDLPAGSYQKESRTQVVLDPVTVAAVKGLLNKAVAAFSKDPERLAPVVNSLAAATHALQESHRVRSLKKDDDLFLHLRESLRKALEGLDKTRFVVLPALKDQEAGAWLAPEALAGRRPVVLDSRLWDFDPATVGGEPLPGSGKSLWSADLARPFVRLGERLLLFGRAAEQFYRSRSLLGQAPVLLNLILGAWLGYGDRPPAEAALGPNPFFSSADVARLVEAMLLDVRGAKPTDAESPRALLEKLAALPPSAQALAAPLIRRSLDSGVLPLELGLQLDRIAAALRLLPHMPPETIATESPLAPNMSRAGGRTFTTIRSEGRESLYELRGAEKIPIAGLQEKTGIRSIVRQGGRYWVTVGYGGESRLYQIRGTRASPVPGLPGANSFDEKGGRLFARVIHPDTTDTIYEILPEQAVPIQGLENLVNAYTPAPAGGRLWAKAQTASDRWTLFEVRDRQAFPVPELRDKTEIGGIVTQDGRVFVEVQEDEEQSLLELKGSSWLPVPGLARRPLGSMIGPLEIGGRLWVGLDDADGLRSYFELKGDALLPVAGLQKVAARGLLPGPGGEAWIALPREDGRQSYHAIRGLALEPVPGLEAKVSFGVPHIAGGRAFVHAAEEKADSRTLYELRDGRAAAVPGLSGKKSITPRHVAGRVFFVTEEQDGTNLLYESSEGRARRIPGVSSFPNFLETGHGRILLHTTKDGIHTVSSLEEEGAVVVPGLEKLTSFDAPEAAGRHMLQLALEGSEHYLLQDPAAPLSWISMAPLPPDAVSVPAGLSEEEKNLLAHNLLRLAWSPAEWRALGWALPYLNGAFFDRLTPETRALCAAELGGLREDVQRAAAGFLAGAGRAVGEDAKLDRIVSRWLLVFKADASRALHLASSLKDEEHILDEEDAAEQPPLVQFLTGRISLEPLRAEEAQDTSSRVLGRSLEEIPLSALAGARANWGPATAKGAALSVADLHGLPRSGYPQTEQAIERAHGAEAGYEWTREGVQNGVKASEQAGVAPRVELTTRVAQRGGRSELRASVRDHGAGMDVREQLFHLLALERSSFAEGDDPSNGFNGRGWYKFLVRADRVRVVTGKKGSGRHTELELYRKPRPEGGFRWQVARFVELEGAFEGTRMDWIQERPGSIAENTLAMELESALIADSVETYAGALGEFGVGILMNGRRVSEQVSALGAVEWAPGEEVRVVRTSSKKRRVLQKGYFIMDLEQDPELLALLPGELRRFLRERGLSLSLPVSRKPHALSISPDRDRSALAGKERYMERLQKAVLAATARAAAREMAEGLWRPRGLPQDYLYRSGHLWASTGTLRHSAHELAKALEGRWDSVNPAAVRERLPDGGDGAALAHFLAYVKFPWNGRELSLATLREDVILLAQAEKEGGGKLAGVRAMLEERRRALMDLPDGYRAMYREAWRRYRDLAGATAKEERWKEDEEPPSPEESRRRSLLAGLISGVMTPLLRERMKQPKAFYRVLFGKTPYPRVAVFGKDWLGLNLNAGQVQSWLDWADRATSGESTPEEDYKQLFELVETAVHEDAHAWEPTGMETHNAEFLERMRATFLDMARKRTVPEDFLRRATAERAAGLR